jgi:hypothetical protein
MAIDFPNSPNNGDSFTSNDKTWQYNGTSWVVIAGSVSIDAGSVTASKLADNAVTSAKISTGAVHQTHLTSGLSGITVTTTANRSTDVPSPFTGQTIYLSDVKRLQVWDGSAWTFITNGAPGAPTALSATPLSTTSVSVAFTTGTINGSAVTNYKYAYSSDSGSTYSEFAALDPVDTASPIVISGLVGATTYLIKLRAVSDFGDSVDSSAVSVTTLTPASAPTSLSTIAGATSAGVAFTAGATGGSAFTNIEYALSTNSGATYSAWTALSPADYTSPITISGLSSSTLYYIKLRHITTVGSGTESSAVSVTTSGNFSSMEILMVAGGGGGGHNDNFRGSPGGAGGLIHITSYPVQVATNYSVSIAGVAALDTQGSNTTYSGNSRTLTALGGGHGRNYDSQGAAPAGGSSGGSWYPSYVSNAPTQTSTTNDGVTSYANTGFGNAGGTSGSTPPYGSGGGGAGGAGANFNAVGGPVGGIGKQISITGTATYYAGGGGSADYGGGGNCIRYAGGLGGGGRGDNCYDNNDDRHGTANTGGGGGSNGQGGSGVVILRYSSAQAITLGAGLTGSTDSDGLYFVTTITAGSGNVSWT